MNLEDYAHLSNYLSSLTVPDNLSLDKRKWINANHRKYHLNNNILYRKNARNVDQPLRVIKVNEIEDVLRDGHSDLYSGHLGIENTFHKINRQYYWPQMWRDIEQYIQSCDVCQRKTPLKKNNHLTPIRVGGPFEKIGIDLVGPLATTTRENRHIVVAIDYVTKWVEARAIKDASAASVIPFLIEDIIAHHGYPKELISDRGSTFVNEIVREFNEANRIKHRLATPYHPQTNGLVERVNQTICKILSKYVQLYQQDWDEYLPYALFAYRTMRQNTTRFEPFYLTYGRTASTPFDLRFQIDDDKMDVGEAVVRRVCVIIDGLETDREEAVHNINKQQQKQKQQYDNNKMVQRFQIGQKVLLRRMETQNWHHDKLGEKWKGPYFIHDAYDRGAYKLRTLDGKVLKNPYSGDHLKSYSERLYLEPIVIIT
jgi:Integrase zinc binding domain/Integrase core domain